MNLTYEEMDHIVTQGVELGTYVYLFTGGEPMARKKDIIRLCEEHPDCVFSTFTNGTLIDEAFAEEMLRVKNFVPSISIEGFEEATESRRGEGTYQKIIHAMGILKEKKLPFGISCCYTSANAEVIGSEAYFDQMIEMGAKFAWFFTYMPVGKGAVKELMVTAEQREMMYHKIREYRQTKPLFTIDFWNDGEYVGACCGSALGRIPWRMLFLQQMQTSGKWVLIFSEHIKTGWLSERGFRQLSGLYKENVSYFIKIRMLHK